MRIFKLEERVGWGNEIHLETVKGVYAGSGRCAHEDLGIVFRKPEIWELKKKLRTSGHCSKPYVKNGDLLTYKSKEGKEIKFKFKNVRYVENPPDMFFGELKYIDPTKELVRNKIKKGLKNLFNIIKPSKRA